MGKIADLTFFQRAAIDALRKENNSVQALYCEVKFFQYEKCIIAPHPLHSRLIRNMSQSKSGESKILFHKSC